MVFGDRDGGIGFSLVGALPLRSPLALEGGGAAHDGSASQYDWRAIVPHELMPHAIHPKRGALFTANHRPVGSFYPIPLGVRTGSGGDTVRSWRLRELLPSKASLTPEQALQVHYDAVNPARRQRECQKLPGSRCAWRGIDRGQGAFPYLPTFPLALLLLCPLAPSDTTW